MHAYSAIRSSLVWNVEVPDFVFTINVFFFQYIIAGGLTIGAAQKKTSCFVISSMVMSIIASVFVWNQIGFAATSIGMDNDYYQYYDRSSTVQVCYSRFHWKLSLMVKV